MAWEGGSQHRGRVFGRPPRLGLHEPVWAKEGAHRSPGGHLPQRPLCLASEAPRWGQVGGIVTGLLGPELSLYHGRAGTSWRVLSSEPNQTVQQGREQQGTRSPSQEAGLQVPAAPTPAPDAALRAGRQGPRPRPSFPWKEAAR